MEKIIYNDGEIILERGGKYYLRHDVGHFNVKMRDDEISEEEAIKAQKSKQDLIDLINKCIQR